MTSKYLPGDLVDYEGETYIVIGCYALLHANTMDNIRPNDVRFRDYRIISPKNSKIPMTWIQEDMLHPIYTAKESEKEDKQSSMMVERIQKIYDLIVKKDSGGFIPKPPVGDETSEAVRQAITGTIPTKLGSIEAALTRTMNDESNSEE